MEDEPVAVVSNEPYQWLVGEDFTIYAIETLKEQVSQEISLHDSVEVNLSQVEEIDSSGIQLLLALRAELLRKDKGFKISAMSPVVMKMVGSYGLADRFN